MRPASTASSGVRGNGGDPRRHRRRQRGGVRGQIHAALVVFGRSRGREAYGAAATQHVGDQLQTGRALGDYRRRQVGRDQDIGRPPLPAPFVDRGKEILALRGERRAPSPLRGRTTTGPHRGGAARRHEVVPCLGGILQRVLPHPRGL